MFKKLRSIKLLTGREKPRPVGKLPIKTDIHAHLVPGIDDGSDSLQTSLELMRGLADLGIEAMVLTPHVTDEVFPNTVATIDPPYNELREALRESGVPMRLAVSAEYRIDDQFRDHLAGGAVRPMPDGYILIECPWISEPFGLDTFVNDLVRRHGLKPIIAHPERYRYYIERPESYRRLRDLGLRFQLNLLSLAGYYGDTIRRNAEALLDEGMVEFVGTDMHHARHLQTLRDYTASRQFALLERHASSLLNDSIFYNTCT